MSKKARKSDTIKPRKRKNKSKFDILQPGKTYKDPKTGQETQLPSLQAFVDEQYAFKSTTSLVELCVRLYGCAPVTVHRCLARSREMDAELMSHDRGKRVQNMKSMFLNIARAAFKEKDFKAASDAVLNVGKIAGDMRPIIVAPPSMPAGSVAEVDDDELLKIIQPKAS